MTERNGRDSANGNEMTPEELFYAATGRKIADFSKKLGKKACNKKKSQKKHRNKK